MSTYWAEEQVTCANVVQLFRESFSTTNRYSVHNGCINIFTSYGYSCSVRIDEKRKFIRLFTYLILDKSRPRSEKLEFVQRLNDDVFMGKFSISEPDDVLHVSYGYCYQLGLCVEQLLIILVDFGLMLAHVVDEKTDRDWLIKNAPDDVEYDPNSEAMVTIYKATNTEGEVVLAVSQPNEALLH
jgi:hypothetical protein